VGTASRAAVLAAHFDGAGGSDPKGRDVPGIFFHESGRGFTVYTGKMNGVPVSVVAIGMGMAMMDFLVRELR
jgi:uridine phosphorylase